MKPSLGRKVYCLYNAGIFEDTVGYIGKDSFIIGNFNDYTSFNSLEWFYEDYDITWFTSLGKAKKALIDKEKKYIKPGEKVKVVETDDGWWELEFVQKGVLNEKKSIYYFNGNYDGYRMFNRVRN